MLFRKNKHNKDCQSKTETITFICFLNKFSDGLITFDNLFNIIRHISFVVVLVSLVW